MSRFQLWSMTFDCACWWGSNCGVWHLTVYWWGFSCGVWHLAVYCEGSTCGVWHLTVSDEEVPLVVYDIWLCLILRFQLRSMTFGCLLRRFHLWSMTFDCIRWGGSTCGVWHLTVSDFEVTVLKYDIWLSTEEYLWSMIFDCIRWGGYDCGVGHLTVSDFEVPIVEYDIWLFTCGGSTCGVWYLTVSDFEVPLVVYDIWLCLILRFQLWNMTFGCLLRRFQLWSMTFDCIRWGYNCGVWYLTVSDFEVTVLKYDIWLSTEEVPLVEYDIWLYPMRRLQLWCMTFNCVWFWGSSCGVWHLTVYWGGSSCGVWHLTVWWWGSNWRVSLHCHYSYVQSILKWYCLLGSHLRIKLRSSKCFFPN